MKFETRRLILRPWEEADANSLYEYAKDERIGPSAGWQPLTSVENSRDIIIRALSAPEIYAICLKEDNRAIGCVSLVIGRSSVLGLEENQGELGYWIGVPFWGRGLVTEAARVIIRHAFDDLGLESLWSGHFEGNAKSRRVQEHCGFIYHHTNKDIFWAQLNDLRTEHIMCLTRERWDSFSQ